MGIYVFATDVMYERLFRDAARKEASRHDFGHDIIPDMLADSRVFAYPFRDENRKEGAYWRDVGTLDAYYQTSMDLIQVDPILNLYDRDWPIHTYQPPMPPPKFVHSEADRRGAAYNSIVCQGAIISGGQVFGSILSPGVRINSFARLSRTRSSSTGSRSAATPGSARRSSTRTSRSPPTSRSATSRDARPRPGLRHHRGRPDHRRQGGGPGAVRTMTPDGDFPMIGQTARSLGVRVGDADDIPERDGFVRPGTGGMSVAPRIEDLPRHRIPRRLRHRVPEATGRVGDVCWVLGEGPFEDGPVAERLLLRPDKPGHGLVEPAEAMATGEYLAGLAATRESWRNGEG